MSDVNETSATQVQQSVFASKLDAKLDILRGSTNSVDSVIQALNNGYLTISPEGFAALDKCIDATAAKLARLIRGALAA